MDANPVSQYASTLRPTLSARHFEPEPSRIAWLILHLAIVVSGIVLIGLGIGGLAAAIPLSLLIGHSFAGMAFVAHEALHGAVVRSRALRYVIGWIAFMPFMLSPSLWIAWHNRVHHGHTARAGKDPDAYPTLVEYRASRVLKWIDRVSPGAKHPLGVFALFVGFTVQSLSVLLSCRKTVGFSSRQRRVAIAETLVAVALWSGVALAIGPLPMLFAFVIPLLVGNAIVMGYIFTNHSLSPLTDVNDPLLNSLSVSAPRWVQALHLNFGYHVEHHIFPAMSSRHAPAVRDAIVARWPERYQSMSHLDALARLFTTPRIYKDPVTLCDPRTGTERPTLLPQYPSAARSR